MTAQKELMKAARPRPATWRQSITLAGLLVLFVLLSSTHSYGGTITFTGQPGSNPFGPFTEAGFDVSPAGGFPGMIQVVGNPAPSIVDGLFGSNRSRVVRSGGGLFIFDSIDALVPAGPIILKGFVSGVQTETQTIPGGSIPLPTFVTVLATFNAPIDELVIDSNATSCCSNFYDNIGVTIHQPNQPPDCSQAVGNPAIVWPPNHKFVSINISGVTDPDGDPVTITIDSIFQDEPVGSSGSGNTAPDAKGVGTNTAEIRAERSGTKKLPGNGRVYHIGYTADDGKGGTCSSTVKVIVPHDKGKAASVDEGALFDSTIAP